VTFLTVAVGRNISEEPTASIFTVIESSAKLQLIAGKKTTIFSFIVCKLDVFYSDAFFDFDVYLFIIIINSSKFSHSSVVSVFPYFSWSTYVSSACWNVFLYTFSPMALQP
jgi:hypothetical protein